MVEKIKTYLWLFGVNCLISAFTFGGGYVVIPMIRKYFAEKKNIINEEELLELAAIAQSSPGAIAVNLAALAGVKTAGLIGAIISCISAVLPPLVIISVLSLCYEAFGDNRVVLAILKGMEAGVAALIVNLVFDLCVSLFRSEKKTVFWLVPVVFAANLFGGVSAALLIGFCCMVSLFIGYISIKKSRTSGRK